MGSMRDLIKRVKQSKMVLKQQHCEVSYCLTGSTSDQGASSLCNPRLARRTTRPKRGQREEQETNMSTLHKTVTTMAAGAAMLGVVSTAHAAGPGGVKNIVLVHGGFVDGSGWEGVFQILKKDGYNVTIVQNPTTSLADDVAVTKRAIAAAPGPVILVGHSYGGVVGSEAGTDPKVAAVVYITAFAPDKGESVSSLIANPPPGAPVPPIPPPQVGYLFPDRAKFAASFAADVEPGMVSFMADSQVPWGVDALSGAVSEPAWKTKPSYYLVTSDDKMIPPPAQRKMAERAKARVTEVAGSHSVYVFETREGAKNIEKNAASSY